MSWSVFYFVVISLYRHSFFFCQMNWMCTSIGALWLFRPIFYLKQFYITFVIVVAFYFVHLKAIDPKTENCSLKSVVFFFHVCLERYVSIADWWVEISIRRSSVAKITSDKIGRVKWNKADNDTRSVEIEKLVYLSQVLLWSSTKWWIALKRFF